MHITQAFKRQKAVTAPLIHEVQIQFNDTPSVPRVFARHPKTNWLYWQLDYRDLEDLSSTANNKEIGEFSIRIARDFQEMIAKKPGTVSNFPVAAIDDAVDRFRLENYSFIGRLTPSKTIDASEVRVRFLCEGNCLQTTVTILFFLGRKELYRRPLTTIGGGKFTEAEFVMSFDVYDHALTFHPLNSPKLEIHYEDLPISVRKNLPTNAQLHAEWGTPYNPSKNSQNYLP